MRLGCREPSHTAGLHDGGGTTVWPRGTIVTLDLASVRPIGLRTEVRRPAELVDKGKPRVTWGRPGLGAPSQPGCRNQ